ncbi:unnamed protein product [Ectocarpus sp. 8 AP-2014]
MTTVYLTNSTASVRWYQEVAVVLLNIAPLSETSHRGCLTTGQRHQESGRCAFILFGIARIIKLPHRGALEKLHKNEMKNNTGIGIIASDGVMGTGGAQKIQEIAQENDKRPVHPLALSRRYYVPQKGGIYHETTNGFAYSGADCPTQPTPLNRNTRDTTSKPLRKKRHLQQYYCNSSPMLIPAP